MSACMRQKMTRVSHFGPKALDTVIIKAILCSLVRKPPAEPGPGGTMDDVTGALAKARQYNGVGRVQGGTMMGCVVKCSSADTWILVQAYSYDS